MVHLNVKQSPNSDKAVRIVVEQQAVGTVASSLITVGRHGEVVDYVESAVVDYV